MALVREFLAADMTLVHDGLLIVLAPEIKKNKREEFQRIIICVINLSIFPLCVFSITPTLRQPKSLKVLTSS